MFAFPNLLKSAGKVPWRLFVETTPQIILRSLNLNGSKLWYDIVIC